jgi:uncharacterized phage infection (PIP) family protein YhgE
MTDMPMSGPGTWGKGKPRNLQEALAGVKKSLDLVETTVGKVKGSTADHVMNIKDAAKGLLKELDNNSSGQQVRTRLGQFHAGTQAAKTAVNAKFEGRDMTMGPVIALLGSVADLDDLAQNL